MNILQLTLSFSPSGRSRAICTLADGLAAHDIHSHLACLGDLGGGEKQDLSVFEGVIELKRRGGRDYSVVRQIARLCEERNVDLIHAHDAASQWAAVSSRLFRRRTKVVMTFHRSLSFESARFRDRLRNAVAGAFTAAIVVGSRERRQHYLGENRVPGRKVVRIPFGVNLNQFRPDPVARESVRAELGVDSRTTLVGCVGHFGQEKGIDVAIEAFARLAAVRADLRFQLAVFGTGRPGECKRMRSLAASVGDRVLFCGFRSDIERCFAAMDVFLHTPRQEAFGLVVAEAMASGLPVIASRAGGIPDLVVDRQTGVLVAPDSPVAVVAALSEVLQDEFRRQTWGELGRSIAKSEFSAERFAQRHAVLYREIIAGERPTGVDGGNERPVVQIIDPSQVGVAG